MSSNDETSPKPEARKLSNATAPGLASEDDAAVLGMFVHQR